LDSRHRKLPQRLPRRDLLKARGAAKAMRSAEPVLGPRVDWAQQPKSGGPGLPGLLVHRDPPDLDADRQWQLKKNGIEAELCLRLQRGSGVPGWRLTAGGPGDMRWGSGGGGR
jgi:hypothetical protein